MNNYNSGKSYGIIGKPYSKIPTMTTIGFLRRNCISTTTRSPGRSVNQMNILSFSYYKTGKMVLDSRQCYPKLTHMNTAIIRYLSCGTLYIPNNIYYSKQLKGELKMHWQFYIDKQTITKDFKMKVCIQRAIMKNMYWPQSFQQKPNCSSVNAITFVFHIMKVTPQSHAQYRCCMETQ